MDEILSAINCSNCQKSLKNPLLLPCNHSVCEKHVTEEQRSIKCLECGQEHEKPEHGFVKNLALQRIIETGIERMDLGPAYRQVNTSCKKFNLLLDEIENLTQNPDNYIHSLISDLKTKVFDLLGLN